MGPKKADNTNKGRRPSQTALVPTEDQENQQCNGKFAADLEFCCREPTLAYPVNIPVFIRAHTSSSLQIPQPLGTHSGASIAPSLVGGIGEEQLPLLPKRPSRGRIPSMSHTGIGIDNDNKSMSIPGQEPSKSSSTSYKTFHLVRDSEFFRPKLLVDTIDNENEPIDEINTLYMRAWQLDQRFIDILKKILPLQEQLHTLNFCFVGLNQQTIYGLAEVCQLIKNLKTVSLDGNPLAADHFHIFIEKDDLKILNLSLRFCKITDKGAERLANILGNMSTQNWKLLTLTLTGNQIGDNGAKSFAKALRYNRTLISLNLSSNFITDKGACALALVLRKIVLTEEEIIHQRYLLSERYAETYSDDMRNFAPSPTLSIASTKSRSGREPRLNKRRKSLTTKSTDKRHRIESSDDSRPPSAAKGDQKKGKTDGISGRSLSVNPLRSSTDQPRASANVRGKKLTSSSILNASKKNISIVKEEDENVIEELMTLQIQHIERENPLLEMNEIESHNGEIILKGNLVLLNLNLSRNYLTLITVNEFLLSIQYQMKLTHFNDTSSISTTTASLIDFSGLCRLELKGINDISIKSPIYQSLETLLLQKNPTIRFQQIKEREAKDLHDQQSIQVSQPIILEKTRVTSSVKSLNQRPVSRIKD